MRDGQYRSSLLCKNKTKKDFTAELLVTLLQGGGSAPAGMVAMVSVAKEK